MERVLVTGGTGLIGSELTQKLIQSGYEVVILSRSKKENTDQLKFVTWDIKAGRIDSEAYEGVQHIIHLAGAGVADKRWTESYKKVLHDSRIESARLILNNLPVNHTVKTFISASGINYYGTKTVDKIFKEEDAPGEDYLAQLTVKWEAAAAAFKSKNIRVVKLRTPLVMAKEGGALPTIAKPIKMGFGSPLGSGKQFTPWVHIDDLVQAYIHSLNSDTEGSFNVVAPQHLTNKELTQKIAKELNKKLWLPNVPGFVLKLMLGSERSGVVLEGSRAEGSKITKTGFEYKFKKLDLSNLL